MFKTIAILLMIGALNSLLYGQAADSTPKTFGEVYFYRVEEVNKLDSRKVEVKIDGKALLLMPEDSYIGFKLVPGKYGLRMRQKQSEILLTVEGGKRVFIRVSQTVAGFLFNQSLTIMPEEQAIFQMRDMKPLEDKNIKDGTKGAVKVKPILPT
jgi:hypothetical protein